MKLNYLQKGPLTLFTLRKPLKRYERTNFEGVYKFYKMTNTYFYRKLTDLQEITVLTKYS